MAILVGIALGMMVGGLVVAWLSSSVKQPLLATVFYWAGLIVAICGLFLVVAPVIVYVAGHLRAALGIHE